jgi:uncharacterized protein (TIGR02117 family)
LALAACAQRSSVAPPPAAFRDIHVVSNGWHTSIAIPRRDIPAGTLTMAREVRGADWVLFGWGERHYYATGDRSPWAIFSALCLPSGSALHVIPFRGPVPARFPRCEIITLRISRAGLNGLCAAIDESFARRQGKLVPIGPGYYRGSRFYLGARPYYFPNTCNVWTARMLKAGGYPLRSGTAWVADDLMAQLRPHGWQIANMRRPGNSF